MSKKKNVYTGDSGIPSDLPIFLKNSKNEEKGNPAPKPPIKPQDTGKKK